MDDGFLLRPASWMTVPAIECVEHRPGAVKESLGELRAWLAPVAWILCVRYADRPGEVYLYGDNEHDVVLRR